MEYDSMSFIHRCYLRVLTAADFNTLLLSNTGECPGKHSYENNISISNFVFLF